MSDRIIFAGFFVFLMILALFSGAVAAVEEDDDIKLIDVEDAKVEPATLLPGEEGTLSFTLRNIGYDHVRINEISLANAKGLGFTVPAYLKYGFLIASDDIVSFALPFTAPKEEGVYYPVLYLDYYTEDDEGTFVKQIFTIPVNSRSLALSVISRPPAFIPGKAQHVSLCIGNLRNDPLTAVSVTVSGAGAALMQGTAYVGEIKPGETGEAELSIVTAKETTEVVLEVSYRNDEGNAWHTEKLSLPLTAPSSEFGADLLVNKIELGSEGGYSAIRGVVHNAGISPAAGLSVTTEGVGKCGEYPTDFVGELEGNASASFTVTFADSFGENITLVLNYRDMNGNSYTKKEKIVRESIPVDFDDAENESIEPVVKPEPVNWILVAVLCAIVGAVVVGGSILIWRKYHPKNTESP